MTAISYRGVDMLLNQCAGMSKVDAAFSRRTPKPVVPDSESGRPVSDPKLAFGLRRGFPL